MRLKDFIIFIIIFSIIYFLAFYIYDIITNKKAIKRRNDEVKSLIDINKYIKFCAFYGLNPKADINILNNFIVDIKSTKNNNFVDLSNKYLIDTNEVIIIILFFEYLGIIEKRKIIINNSCSIPLNDNDDTLLVKYSICFLNKYDYETIITKMGLNSEKELIYINDYYLFPGVYIKNKNIYYMGDLND